MKKHPIGYKSYVEYLKDLVKDSSFWHLQITEKSRGINVFNDDVDHYKTIHVILL